MIIWGGRNGPYPYLSSGGRYSPSSNSWLTTSIGANVPAGRITYSAVWTGSSMIVWGGDNGSLLDNGGIYSSGSISGPGNSLWGGKSSTIDMTWNAIAGATSYNVKRCAGVCTPNAIVATPAINSYSEPFDATSYFYAVEAVNSCGISP